MKKFSYILIIPLIFSCTNIPYKTALKIYKHQDYKSAIEQFDNSILQKGNPALKVKAKFYRSECYYELGRMEMEKENHKVAADLLFLANSDKADNILDNCYYEIAKDYIQKMNYDFGYYYLNFITENLWDSELTPEILYTKIKIEFEVKNNSKKSYKIYQSLQDNFPESESFQLSKKIANQYITDFILDAKKKWINNEFNSSLESLFIYLKYPADFKNEIKSLIGNVYFSLGEDLFDNDNLEEAEQNFRQAGEYNSQLVQAVLGKLNQICIIHIENGNSLLAQRNIDEAIASYQKTLNIIEGYELALEKINYANEIAENIKKANELVLQGDKHFEEKEYQKAMDTYTLAYQFDKIVYIQEKINNAYIWLRITTDPEKYALELLEKYRKGIIIKKISEIEEEALKKFSRKDIKIIPWQVFRSPAKNNYEVRYSIITPEKNYFLFWLVKLETGTIRPLNKDTEAFLS